MTRRDIIPLIKDTVTAWREDGASRLAAAISYYTIFSLVPVLVLAIAIVSQIYTERPRERIRVQTSRYLGSEVAEALGVIIESAQEPAAGALASLIAAVTLLVGASAVFAQLMGALDEIWHVRPVAERGFLGSVQDRFLAFGMVVVGGLLFLLTLVASFVLTRATEVAGIFAPSWLNIAPIFNVLGSLILAMLLFAAIYKILPRVTLAWRDVWIGAAVTAVLFVLGKELIGLYLGLSDPSSGYGAAGSLVVLLIFVYYSSQVFLLGAEFTKVYASRYGSRVKVEEGAVRYRIVTSSEPTMQAVAASLPQEEVQLTARAVAPEPQPPAPAPEASAASRREPPQADGIDLRLVLVSALAFVIGLVIGGRR